MIIQSLIGLVVSLAILIWSCNFAIKNSIAIAKRFKIRDIFVGIFIIAIGTSLPEFAATFQALQLKSEGIVAGNLVGSNIFNVLFALGITTAIKPISVNPAFLAVDGIVLLGVILLFLLFATSKKEISKFEGVSMILVYVAYMSFLVWRL